MDKPLYPLVVLRDNPDVSVARIALGLTVYIDEPLHWAQEAASAALAAFFMHAPSERLQLYTTSLLAEWRPTSPTGLEKLTNAISSWLSGRPRHLFWFRVVDDPGAPSVGFSYREVDNAREGRSGFLQIVLPRTHADGLLKLAMIIGHRFPILSAVGGYLATWNERQKPTAFTEIHHWSRRYLGLDVQDPDAMAWSAPHGLPGAGWLTMIGSSLARRLKINPRELANHQWEEDVTAQILERAILLRAGQHPTLGDVNQLTLPSAYIEVARHLNMHLAKEPPRFWGEFYTRKDSGAWFRRLVEPDKWAHAS